MRMIKEFFLRLEHHWLILFRMIDNLELKKFFCKSQKRYDWLNQPKLLISQINFFLFSFLTILAPEGNGENHSKSSSRFKAWGHRTFSQKILFLILLFYYFISDPSCFSHIIEYFFIKKFWDFTESHFLKWKFHNNNKSFLRKSKPKRNERIFREIWS